MDRNGGDRGGSTEDREAARSHYQQGVKFYTEGEFKVALIEFRRAYELSHNFRILYNIGQVNHQLSNYTTALRALEQYLREGAGSLPEARRAEVQRDIAALRTKIGYVELATNVDDADVLIDDIVVGKTPVKGAITVDAGDHRIEIRREGYHSAVRTLTLAGRETARLELRLTEQKSMVVVAAGPSSAPVASERYQPKTPMLEWVGWISTGALALGAGVSGILATTEASHLSALRDSATSTAAERESSQNQARGFAIATDVLAAAAVVTGATTLYFSLRSRRAATSASPTPPSTRLVLGAKGLGLSLVHDY